MSDALRDPGDGVPKRRGSFIATMRAVAWSFFGVRKGSDHERDLQQLSPVHIVVAGVLGAVLFVIVLIVLVRWIIGSGIAG